jgi:hypothetical protein
MHQWFAKKVANGRVTKLGHKLPNRLTTLRTQIQVTANFIPFVVFNSEWKDMCLATSVTRLQSPFCLLAMCTEDNLPESRTVGGWSWPLTSTQCRKSRTLPPSPWNFIPCCSSSGDTLLLPCFHVPGMCTHSLKQWFSTWGTRTPWGYAVRAQKSLDLVTKSLSWLITQ